MSDTGNDAFSREELERSLATALGGFEVLERALEVPAPGPSGGGGARTVRAELAGLDGAQRLWFVVRADEDEERAFLDALELVAFARSEGGRVAQEIAGERALSSDASRDDVRVAIVARSPSPALVRRASAVRSIALFDVVRWKGERGERVLLAPRAGAPASTRTVDELLATFAEPARALARRCIAGASRVDPELELVATETELAWRDRGREIARVSASGAGLSSRVERGATLAIASERDVERWLEHLIDGCFTRERGRFARVHADDDLPPLPDDDRPARDDPRAPLLSAEELAAFRE